MGFQRFVSARLLSLPAKRQPPAGSARPQVLRSCARRPVTLSLSLSATRCCMLRTSISCPEPPPTAQPVASGASCSLQPAKALLNFCMPSRRHVLTHWPSGACQPSLSSGAPSSLKLEDKTFYFHVRGSLRSISGASPANSKQHILRISSAMSIQTDRACSHVPVQNVSSEYKQAGDCTRAALRCSRLGSFLRFSHACPNLVPKACGYR